MTKIQAPAVAQCRTPTIQLFFTFDGEPSSMASVVVCQPSVCWIRVWLSSMDPGFDLGKEVRGFCIDEKDSREKVEGWVSSAVCSS